jgi:hypothetical protein
MTRYEMTYKQAMELLSGRLRMGDSDQCEAKRLIDELAPLQKLARESGAELCPKCDGEQCQNCQYRGLVACGKGSMELFRAEVRELAAIVGWIKAGRP